MKPVCVCQSFSVWIRLWALSQLIFTKIGTDVKKPKGRKSSLGGQYRTTPSSILSHKTPILGQKVLKTQANIK